MKKILSVLLTVIMLLASVSCLSVLAVDECEIYGHRYGDWYAIQQATCTVVGLEGRKCEFCNDIETRKLGLNPDNHVSTQIVKANGDGTHDVKCVACEKILAENCRYSPWVNDGNGTDSCYCYKCRATHTSACVFSDTCVPDSSNPGTHIYNCTQCGTAKSEACNFVTEKTVAATCTKRGYVGLYCKCGNCSVTQMIDALGHTDADGDNKCDRCSADLSPAVTEPVQPSGEKTFLDKIMDFINRIIAWFESIFA